MSKLRAKRKRKMSLPTKKIFDPFLEKVFYINRNGRLITQQANGRWQAIKEEKRGKRV